MGTKNSIECVRSTILDVYGGKYTFPFVETEYINQCSKLTGICELHGEFYVTFDSIRNKKPNCPKCNYSYTAELFRMPISEVLNCIQRVHRGKYNFPYVKDEYINQYSKLTGFCPEHGEFKVAFDKIKHRGTGCQKCGNENKSKKQRLSIDDVRRCILDKVGSSYIFPYIEDEYKNDTSKLSCICPTHGFCTTTFNTIRAGSCCCYWCGREKANISKRNVITQNGLSDYKSYHLKIPIDDCPTEGSYGELQVRCKMCQKLFTPNRNQVFNRIRVINTLGEGESNFYCSDECKQECSIYNVRSDTHILAQQIDNYEAKVKLARNCQLETKRILRQHQMDQFGYHFCEKCGKSVENPELHHTIEVAKDPLGSITIAGQMLVCTECHKLFTAMCK